MPTLALLDAAGVLTGFCAVPDEEWITDSGQVAVPDDCDLERGRYAWDGQAFHPIAPRDPVSDQPPVAALRAIWLGFKAVAEAGVTLPPDTLAWMDQFGRTLDAKGRI